MSGPIRRPAVAGTWYPGRRDDVVAELAAYLDAAGSPPLAGRLVALVSPHAGFRYSGPVAAYGYAHLAGRCDLTVVLVGPAHHALREEPSVYPRGGFETPLGVTPVDEALAAAILAREPRLADDVAPHAEEHSLEMQLPFLQHLVPGLRIVPILMGRQSRRWIDVLAGALSAALAGRDALLVASTDLSHYHAAAVANRLDAKVVADVERLDAEGLMRRLEADPDHACGGGPLVAVLRAASALGADTATILRYADSGDRGERDKSRVVGYLSAALTAAPA